MGPIKNAGFVIKSDDIFSPEDYGKPISERLSEILRRNVSKNDYANIVFFFKKGLNSFVFVYYPTEFIDFWMA